jgi:rhodanese-related sulfurtransferase
MSGTYPRELVIDYFKARAAAYVSPMGLKALLEQVPDETVIVDVRLPGPLLKWRIPGSVVIPANEIESRLGDLPKDKLIVLYCWDTWCSLAAAAALPLLERGYRVKELHGGVSAWQTLNLPQSGLDAPSSICSC